MVLVLDDMVNVNLAAGVCLFDIVIMDVSTKTNDSVHKVEFPYMDLCFHISINFILI